MVNPPRLPPGHPERSIACQEELAPYMNALADAARDAGWSDDEIVAALAMLAECEFMSVEANRSLDDELALIRQAMAER